MWQSFIISLREGLEIVFFLGLMIVYLRQVGKLEYIKYFYTGAFTGFLVVLAGGFTLFGQLQGMNEAVREVFLGCMALFVALVVAYVVVWMKKESESETDKIKTVMKNNVRVSGIFAIAFLTVFREGLEIVIFNLAMLDESMIKIVIGTLLGLAVAFTCNFIIFKTTIKLSVKWLFTIMSLLLIVVGAMMFGEGLIAFMPNGGSLLEYGAAALYAVVCIIYYLKGKVIKNNKIYD